MSVSGLSRPHRVHARDRARDSALLGLRHSPEIHYTQGFRRWDGIRLHKLSREGEYPNYADCSAFVTWCLWNGMYVPYHHADTVNGAHWQGGFTGTLLAHGRRIHELHNVLRADLVLYGGGPNAEHVAIVVGWRNGVPMVVSHGSEAGPLYLPYNYRPVREIRRYI